MEVVIASANKKKIKEMEQILGSLGMTFKTALELGFTDEIEETGTTFQENAIIKAETVCKAVKMPCIADDSGLCVEALDGRPGVYSARYAENDLACCLKLIGEMKDKTNRKAYYVSSIAMVMPSGEKILAEGFMHGEIITEMRGDGGFGYDPLFFIEQFGKTASEITDEQKNSISHRGSALREFYTKFKEKNYAN